MDEAKQLMKERDEIDCKIAENEAILAANNVTMDSPLVDAEGFPIATIDVYSVRHARSQLVCLRNDRVALTEKIGEVISEIHEMLRPNAANAENMQFDNKPCSDRPVHRTSNTPFAKVATVAPNSPAADGGMHVGDLIIQFGSIHHGNFSDIKQVGQLVQSSDGKVIRVTVLRDSRPNRLEIRPGRWNGQGLLGCSIVPETTSNVI